MQDGIAMHMANISLKGLALTTGATYYVRIASTSNTYENVNNTAGKIYTVRVGNYAPNGDSYLDNVTLTLTQQPTYSWLTGQTNRYCGHSMLTEPEQGNLALNIDNSLMYKFNSGSATSVDVKFQNVTYYNHSASTALGQVAVLTAPQFGTSLGSSLAFLGPTYTLTVGGLAANTNYWIVVDGGGTYEGTKLTFDISVSTPQPLAIELTSFTGFSDGTKNILKWNTSTELNNDYFAIERSWDGVVFEELEKIKGAGNSQLNINYTAYDSKVYSGLAYYRLKQTDFDGSYTYSSMIAISHSNKNLISAVIMPNPSGAGSVNLNYNANSESMAYLSIYSVTGQLVQYKPIMSSKGSNSIDLYISEFSKGMYFFNLIVNDGLQKIKFIRE